MKRLFRNFSIVMFLVLLILLSLFDIETIKFKYLNTLSGNMALISNSVFALLPFLTFILVAFLFLTRKWAFRVERLSIGGFNILFDNPNQLFKKQIRTFLDTKRTLFKVDFEHDNIKETLNSYFEVYKILRDEIKILGEVKPKKQNRNNETNNLYYLSNEIIKELNIFLTTHQSNFRRWDTYKEKYDNENYYLTPIGKFQESYWNYQELRDDFEKVNKFFIEKVAQEFEVNIKKWGL